MTTPEKQEAGLFFMKTQKYVIYFMFTSLILHKAVKRDVTLHKFKQVHNSNTVCSLMKFSATVATATSWLPAGTAMI
jgi:hypothetical protein